MLPAGCVVGEQAHQMIGDLHVPVRRDDVDDPRLQVLAVDDRAHGESAATCQNLAQMTEMVGIEVLRQHERGWEIGGQGRDESGERLDATGR